MQHLINQGFTEKIMSVANIIKVFTFSILLAAFIAPVSAEEDPYVETINNFKETDIGKALFGSAYGYAVFPTMGKAALVIGAGHGKGKVFRGGVVTGTTSMSQLSIGFQAGGQGYSQVVFFEDQRAYDEFTSGDFEFGADASAIAITAGATAKTSTTGSSASAGSSAASQQAKGSYSKGMAIVVAGKGGLMFEAAVAGQKYSYEPIGGEKK
jgi:lipid-binding SYLF domain-containing protein